MQPAPTSRQDGLPSIPVASVDGRAGAREAPKTTGRLDGFADHGSEGSLPPSPGHQRPAGNERPGYAV